MHSESFLSRAGRVTTLVLFALVLLAPMAWGQARAQSEFEYPELDEGLRAAIVDSLTTALEEVYVFPELAKEMDDYVHARLAAGDYEEFESPPEFADQLTEDFRSICHDLHLRVGVSEPVPEYTEEDEEAQRVEHEAWVARMAANNFGFAKLEILSGNVGYLKLNGFNPAEYGGNTAVAAMNFLANCDAIIFDLRDNGEGPPR